MDGLEEALLDFLIPATYQISILGKTDSEGKWRGYRSGVDADFVAASCRPSSISSRSSSDGDRNSDMSNLPDSMPRSASSKSTVSSAKLRPPAWSEGTLPVHTVRRALLVS